jgi:hypothetical protein
MHFWYVNWFFCFPSLYQDEISKSLTLEERFIVRPTTPGLGFYPNLTLARGGTL